MGSPMEVSKEVSCFPRRGARPRSQVAAMPAAALLAMPHFDHKHLRAGSEGLEVEGSPWVDHNMGVAHVPVSANNG